MKTARVLVTTECNLRCHYCCNKLPEIQKSFKMTTMDQFLEQANEYSAINISGGEPMMAQQKTAQLLRSLKQNTQARVYLYTNSLILPDEVWERTFSLLDGVNIGLHDSLNSTVCSNLLVWKKILGLHYQYPSLKIRIHVQDLYAAENVKQYAVDQNIGLIIWKMNDCNKIPEDRFII